MSASAPVGESDRMLTFSEAVAFIEGEYRYSVTVETVRQWTSRGARGVRLKSRFIGGTNLTCADWIREFIDDTNAESRAS